MLELTESNLGKRQQALNSKVLEAFNNKINFDEIKDIEEKSDIDRLYKIDLAIAYKNVDYIVDTLKCGDSLYISRGLKCTWLYDDEFKHIINPDYLHHNIFPYISTKMKKKILAIIALHTKDERRADSFYSYCISTKIDNLAYDFLLKASQAVKQEYLNNNNFILHKSIKFEHFFGNSFDLIEFYFNKSKAVKKMKYIYTVDNDIFKFRYIYSFSPDFFLKIMEVNTDPLRFYICHCRIDRYGGRLSKDIMSQHKERVLDKPWLYITKLNMKIILKYSSSDDAKIYLTGLLPDTGNRFWSMNYYSTYKDLFHLLPYNEIYPFLKQLFNTKYPNEPFEMDVYFYRLKYYDLLTVEERNTWALKHLEEKKEILGPGQDFMWYQFVKFELAFPAIKKYIFITTCQNNRAEMMRVLIRSASNQEDLEKLLTHYYERHVNEDRDKKEQFLGELIEAHNVFEFNDQCWKPVYKILHSLNVFETRRYNDMYIMLVAVYNIIHTNEIPDILEPLCVNFFGSQSCLFTLYYGNIKPNQHKIIYEWFMKYFENKIKPLISLQDDEAKKRLVSYIRRVLVLMDGYKKTKDDCPNIIMECIKLHWDTFHDYKWFQTKREIISEGLLLRLLKKDKTLLLNKLPEINNLNSSYNIVTINNLLKRIKIYFSNDVAKSFQTFFEDKLNDKSKNMYSRDVNQIINTLFQVADDNYKINLMSKHAPADAKIQHDTIDKNLLRIQEAICRFAYYSRPPVPLSNMLEYIKGDYIHFCLPMFGHYLVNLPMPQSMKFIEAILNAPVSIQKHGLRMAFVSYDPEILEQLILNVWKKTKNISLRAIIYKSLFDKIKKNEIVQSKLYPVLKVLTLDLHEDDHDDIFNLLVSSALPYNLKGDYLETAWITVQKLPEKSSINNNRKASVMRSVASHIEQINREFCRTQIINNHISAEFSEKQILHVNDDYGISNLIREKWVLTAKYITHYEEDELDSSLEVLQLIMDKSLEMWNDIYDNTYKVRKLFTEFMLGLPYQTDYRKDRERKPYIVPVYKHILQSVEKSWSLEEMYSIIWIIQLFIFGARSVGDGKYNSEKMAITYDHLSCSEVADNFAKEIADFINDLLSKQQFYPSFYPNMGKAIIAAIGLITSWTNLDKDMLTGEVSYALTKFKKFEAYMLALTILPVPNVNCGLYPNYCNVVQAIKDYNNLELNAFMYHKFIYPDYGKRL